MFLKIKDAILSKKNLKRDIIVISLFSLFLSGIVKAGSLDSLGSPSATMYTVNDIFQRLTTNQIASEGDHSFSPSADPAATFHTLKEIYQAIPTIEPAKVKLGQNYLGISGTLLPNGGTTVAEQVLVGKTFFGSNQTDWTLQTGTMPNIGQQNITPNITDQIISLGYHNGTGKVLGDADLISANIKSGVNLFGISGDSSVVDTSSGDAIASEIVLGKKVWVGGTEITGTLANIGQQILTPSTTNQAITLGYHNGTGYVQGDSNLTSGNIKSGVSIFGIAGNSNVVDTSSGDALAGNILSGKKAWVDGVEFIGSMPNIGQQILTPGTTDQAIVLGYHNGTGKVYGDSNLTSANIKSGVSIFGIAGGYPSGTHPLPGDTVATDATATEICNTNEAWTKDGVKMSGTLNLTASAIGAGNTFCGVTGTLLKNEYTGSAGTAVADYAFYTQANGGVDDYNYGGAMPAGSYSSTWKTCNSGNSYCNTTDATNADKKDEGTNLIWSKWIAAGATQTWFWANNCYEPGTVENPGTCVNNGDDACRCVKKPSGLKVGCEAIGDGGWRLPGQKELMQVYIDGSWENLSSAGGNYWSATTTSNNTQTAWYVFLNYGYTVTNAKTNAASYRVRCVR